MIHADLSPPGVAAATCLRSAFDTGGQRRGVSPSSGRFFAVSHLAIPLTVANSAIFVTTGQEQHVNRMKNPDGKGHQVRFRPMAVSGEGAAYECVGQDG
jgi:hypothetical protein